MLLFRPQEEEQTTLQGVRTLLAHQCLKGKSPRPQRHQFHQRRHRTQTEKQQVD